MRNIWTNLALAAFCVAVSNGYALGQEGGGQSGPSGTESIVVDRWLISHSYGKDGESDGSIEDYLGIFEDVDFFPDRGRRVGTTIWTLHRQDGVAEVDLDELFGQRLEDGITFAHVYVWVPGADRTLRLVTRGSCHYPRVMLNGHDLPWPEEAPGEEGQEEGATLRSCPPSGATDTVLARFASGWNAILLGLDAGDGAYTFAAELLPGPADGLARMKIQASRPPGVRRGIPEPWITVPRFELSPELVWYKDQLGGVIEYDLVGWGRAPRSDVRLEIQVGKFKLKGDIEGLRAMRPSTFRVLVPLEALRDAGIGKEPVRITMKWEDVTRRVEPGLRAADIAAAAERPVRAIGWLVPGALSGELSPQEAVDATPPPLPGEAGETRALEWKVPEELAGGAVLLDISDSPATWRMNGAEQSGGERLVLCQGCKKGQQLTIEASSSGAWQAYPAIMLQWEGSKAGSPSHGSAEAWLSRLP